MAYLAFKVILEYEGDQHRTDPYQWSRDIERQEDFVRGGWALIRITAARPAARRGRR
jgi:very-short-patch-repair endonuclease